MASPIEAGRNLPRRDVLKLGAKVAGVLAMPAGFLFTACENTPATVTIGPTATPRPVEPIATPAVQRVVVEVTATPRVEQNPVPAPTVAGRKTETGPMTAGSEITTKAHGVYSGDIASNVKPLVGDGVTGRLVVAEKDGIPLSVDNDGSYIVPAVQPAGSFIDGKVQTDFRNGCVNGCDRVEILDIASDGSVKSEMVSKGQHFDPSKLQ